MPTDSFSIRSYISERSYPRSEYDCSHCDRPSPAADDLSARISGRIANLFCNHYHRSRPDRTAPVVFRLFSSHKRHLYVRTTLSQTFCRLRKVAYHGRGGCLDYGADPARSKLVDRTDVLCPDARAGHMVTAALRLFQNRATRVRGTDDSSAHKPAHD